MAAKRSENFRRYFELRRLCLCSMAWDNPLFKEYYMIHYSGGGGPESINGEYHMKYIEHRNSTVDVAVRYYDERQVCTLMSDELGVRVYTVGKSLERHYFNHWRRLTRRRKENRAASYLQQWFVRWLYDPRREGAGYKRLRDTTQKWSDEQRLSGSPTENAVATSLSTG